MSTENPKEKGKKIARKQVVGLVVSDSIPSTKEGWTDLYNYGIQSGQMMNTFNDSKDGDLARTIIDRMHYEHDKWLKMTPPEYAGAAKCSLNIETIEFQIGANKQRMTELQEVTDEEIKQSAANWQDNLQEVRENNRNARSMLSCCERCGKLVEKRRFCGKCRTAFYCGGDCQKLDWDAGHRDECGKLVVCACCGKLLRDPIMTCARCRGPKYCNRVHQAWHWSHGHKRECGMQAYVQPYGAPPGL